jgi:hypothetical protein
VFDRKPHGRNAATPGGSRTIVIQHERPGGIGNWLPASAAPFRPMMRLCQRRPAVLPGSDNIPPVTTTI